MNFGVPTACANRTRYSIQLSTTRQSLLSTRQGGYNKHETKLTSTNSVVLPHCLRRYSRHTRSTRLRIAKAGTCTTSELAKTTRTNGRKEVRLYSHQAEGVIPAPTIYFSFSTLNLKHLTLETAVEERGHNKYCTTLTFMY